MKMADTPKGIHRGREQRTALDGWLPILQTHRLSSIPHPFHGGNSREFNR